MEASRAKRSPEPQYYRGAAGTGGTTEDTTGDTDRDMDAATATEAGAALSSEGRAIPPSGRGRSSVGLRLAEPF